MLQPINVNELIRSLVSVAYPELQDKEIVASWGRISSFGQVRWSDDDEIIRVRLNKSVQSWHHAGITGLLSHELSHPSQNGLGLQEMSTDEDVVSRGLGPYLAVERSLTGIYEDHVIYRGKDRYLGYRTIRNLLTQREVRDLDVLMSDMNLKPAHQSLVSHDSVLREVDGRTTIVVDGFQFLLQAGVQDPDIKLVDRDGHVYVYSDETLIGQYQVDDDP
jgi:hypothetical protein